jgi:hypothetical protein
VWHPVGELPAAVYWRRRIVVLIVLLGVLAGLTWLIVVLVNRPASSSSGAAARTSAESSLPTPALERVVPSFTTLRTPTPPPPTSLPPTSPPPAAAARPTPPVATPTPVPGGPCTDEMLGLAVRAPATVVVGSKPTFQLVVQNTSRVPCVRPLDKSLQEIVLLDRRGRRLWGSNDCFPGAGADRRTLDPGSALAFPLVWGGLTSEPTCTAPRVPPAAGSYLLRGRLDTKTSPDLPITLTGR